MTGYTPDVKDNDNTDDNQMFICTEIAAAESIDGLDYKTPKAK